jgi:hypothetical protein
LMPLACSQYASIRRSVKLRIRPPNQRLRPVKTSTYRGEATIETSAANCKIQVIYEYKQGELSFFDLTEGTHPDSRYTANLPNHVKVGDLWMSDLGYFCLKTFSKISENGAYFLSRFLVGTALLDPANGKRIHIEKILRNLTGNAYELNVLMGAHRKTRIACRLISSSTMADTTIASINSLLRATLHILPGIRPHETQQLISRYFLWW